MNQSLPQNCYYHVQNPVPAYQMSGTRHRGMSQGPFAHQIPPLPTHQQHTYGPPPTIQQSHQPHPTHHIQPNDGGYAVHSAPPYFPAELRQKLPAFTNSPEGFSQHKRNPSTRTYGRGKWQQIGSDDIHGPKVVFRKESVLSWEDQNHSIGKWQDKESNQSGRRISTASNNSNHHRLSDHHPQQHTMHTGPRQTDRDFATMGRNLQTSGASGHLWGEFRCVNVGRPVNVFAKFDPCPCGKCRDRDRTVFVNRLKEGINQTEGALQCLKQHFNKFGSVESVKALPSNPTCVHVM